MNVVVQGALVGLGVAVFLVAAEYLLIRQAVKERAERLKRAAEFDQTERKRILTIVRFGVLMPPVFAFAFWVIWG